VTPLLCLTVLIGCGRLKKVDRAEQVAAPPPPASEPRPQPEAPAPEAIARKRHSEERLRSEGVAIMAGLPVIEMEAEAKPRSRQAVIDRAVALMIVALKGEGLDQPKVQQVTDDFGALKFFTPQERIFFLNPAPNKKERAQFTWRYECLYVMQWALGFVPELTRPDHIVDASKVVGLLLKEKGSKKFREEARLRSVKELLDEADLIYRYDWACVDARVNARPHLHEVDCEVVQERHYALNWLIGYEGQEWDDVSTDT
jgi:hypothetical protein